MKKEEMIELLKVMRNHSINMVDFFSKSKDYRMANRYKGEAEAYDTVLLMLEDDDFYDDMKEVFLKEKAEND